MDAESQPENLKKSWISKHPRVAIGVILVLCLGPLVNKAVHTDDVLFVWTGQWIQKHPLDFFGLYVNWWFSAIPMWVANYNPPLMSYFLAGVASLFGWHEIALHLGCLVVAFMAALGIYSLAQMWCDRPLLATLVAIFTPAFLVSSSTLMCDVMMLVFWIWALVLWERALEKERSQWQFIGAGALAGLAVLTKYSAITLLPLLPILSILRARKLGSWLLGLAVPVLMLAGYELITARMYGRGLFSAAVHYAHTTHIEFPGGWQASVIIGLAFAGGSLLPLLFFAPWLWRRRAWLAGGMIMIGGLLTMFRLWNNIGLDGAAPDLMKHWGFLIQAVLLTAGGLHVLLLVVAETWRRRDSITLILALWIAGTIYFATVLNWTVNVRSFLPLAPAAAILVVRRLEAFRGENMTDGRLLWPMIPAAAIVLSIAAADYQLANSARTAAEQISAKYKSASHTMWFAGHGAFQYYMEKFGGLPIDVERSLLQPGDTVVVPEISTYITLPAGSVGWIEDLEFSRFSWMNLMGNTENGAAGFYGANFGPVPFTIGKSPVQAYYVLREYSQVQWNSKPTNPKDVQAGDVPSFSDFSFQEKNALTFADKPEVMNQVRLAAQLEAEGKIEDAIQQYRNALSMDSNSPVVLNNLAWLLATTSKPEFRNGEEAVQLATRAVELTDCRQPRFIGTLAAAHAQAGQFKLACEIALTARSLALIINQKEIAANNEKLLSLYSSGKTVDETYNP
jgi:4-amino-4-deoxy-L-arabinose transferase-like glycosyltransferase/tetratricopeptide (TPR) repeat protein